MNNGPSATHFLQLLLLAPPPLLLLRRYMYLMMRCKPSHTQNQNRRTTPTKIDIYTHTPSPIVHPGRPWEPTMPRLRLRFLPSLSATAEEHVLELPAARDAVIEGGGTMLLHTLKAQIASLTVCVCLSAEVCVVCVFPSSVGSTTSCRASKVALGSCFYGPFAFTMMSKGPLATLTLINQSIYRSIDFTCSTMVPLISIDRSIQRSIQRSIESTHHDSLESFPPMNTITIYQGLGPDAQHLVFGEAAFPIQDDTDVRALLLTTSSSTASASAALPILHVLPKAELTSCLCGDGGSCTRLFFGDRACMQPAYVIPGSDQAVCHACSQTCFPPGLLMDAVGAPLKPFACAAPRLCADGLGAYVFEGATQGSMLVKQAEEEKEAQPILPPPALAVLAALEAQALAQQALAMPTEAEAQGLAARLRGGLETVLAYENATLQAKALKAIPLLALHDRALASGGDPQRRPAEYHDLLFRELLAWFKRDFFKWVNNPPCESCGSADTKLVGGSAPTPAEAAGRAGRVEVYECKACSGTTRFPRYNHPGTLLETRRGRCGEWANCFTLCCRAVGFDARYVLDWTDHVWTEVWSEAQGRYLHADSCENLSDHPLVYEAGWGKKLSYVVAFGKDAAVDVTRRYTRQYHAELLARRTEAPEALLARQLASLNAFLRSPSNPAGAATQWDHVDVRLRQEQYELLHQTVLGDARQLPLKPSELQGRVSGDAVWKRIRGEDGQGAGSLPTAAPGCGGGGEALVATCTVPPPVPPDASMAPPEPLAPVIEREEVEGMPLWPSAAAAPAHGPPCLLVGLTSTGASDLMGASLSSSAGPASAFGPDAITINGLGVAVGTRGLNLVVLNLVTGLLERSVAIDTAAAAPDVDGVDEDADPVQAAVAHVLSHVPKGRVVLAVVLGSAHALAGKGTEDQSLWGRGGFPLLRAPGRGQAWLVVGEKDGGPTLKPWVQAVTREEGWGPAKVVFTLPLPPSHSSSSAAAGREGMRWEGGIAALPLLHDMGPAGDGAVADPQAALVRLQAAQPHLPVCGHSHKPGFGLVVFGPTSGVRGGSGWTTVRTHPVPAASTDVTEEEGDVKVRIKRAFDRLVAQGLAPNVAAAQALVAVKEEVKDWGTRSVYSYMFLYHFFLSLSLVPFFSFSLETKKNNVQISSHPPSTSRRRPGLSGSGGRSWPCCGRSVWAGRRAPRMGRPGPSTTWIWPCPSTRRRTGECAEWGVGSGHVFMWGLL
jgi:hypothetical protein